MSGITPEDKTMALIVDLSKTGGRLTMKLMAWSMKLAARTIAKTMTTVKKTATGRDWQGNVIKRGKMSVKNLLRVGGPSGISEVPVHMTDEKLFKRCARKYGVDYAIHRVPGENKAAIFLKASDQEVVLKLFQEFAGKALQQAQKPSTLEALREELPQEIDAPELLAQKVKPVPER